MREVDLKIRSTLRAFACAKVEDRTLWLPLEMLSVIPVKIPHLLCMWRAGETLRILVERPPLLCGALSMEMRRVILVERPSPPSGHEMVLLEILRGLLVESPSPPFGCRALAPQIVSA